MMTVELECPSVAGSVTGPPAERRDTILVVDDEETIRYIVPLILERRGYRVLIARDGMQALRICSEFPGHIDLLLTDLMMPRMNGWDVARFVKRDRPATKVLYMSGYAESVLSRQEACGA